MMQPPTSSLQEEYEDMDSSNNHVRWAALTVRTANSSDYKRMDFVAGYSVIQKLWMCGTESNGDTTFMDRTFLSDPI